MACSKPIVLALDEALEFICAMSSAATVANRLNTTYPDWEAHPTLGLADLRTVRAAADSVFRDYDGMAQEGNAAPDDIPGLRAVADQARRVIHVIPGPA